MGTSNEQMELRRSRELLVVALLVAGVAICTTLTASIWSRYFWVEDSGVKEGTATFDRLVGIMPSEQGLFAVAVLLIVLAAAGWFWRPPTPSQERRG